MATETATTPAAQGNTDTAKEQARPTSPLATPETAAKPATPEGKPAQAQEASKAPEAQAKPDDKPAEKPAPKAPEKYNFAVPEGFKLDDELSKKTEAVLRKGDIPQDVAQELVELSIEQQRRTLASVERARDDLAESWQTEFRNDPAFGGSNFDASIALARKALDKYEPGLSKELSESEWGSNPSLLRLLAKVGKSVSEDNAASVAGAFGAARNNDLRDLYPTMAR